ncbi:ABC transporter substrate-binding protein [Reinekea marinisedimentorum]|uniref:Peptide/nickel transport system substrate-binding protein n=1 Tax=Reinekea marinisedimentorum TaxID=230495 RepID=A0A4R3IAJ6_9GAMM|nr:ABC transporter substrate-binding protein [Reinekea marinisedimentorum]TCS43330.1 peptide/nickel transport system substrate-binding protein [Reinekea marinisedimentorum]
MKLITSTLSCSRQGFVKTVKTGLLATVLAFSGVQAYALSELNVAQGSDPQNLDPIDTFRLSWGSIGSNIFEGLIQRGEDLQLVPGLATAWEFLDDNSRIRFTLREGVSFHNGEPFNAAAVKYTFDRLLGEQGQKGPQRSNYTSIGSVEVIDDYTVEFHMNQVDPVLITKLAGYGAMIVPPKYIEEVGEEAFDRKPVGTGPYQVVSYEPSVELKLARFEGYWNGTAKTELVNIRFISEPATRMAELMSGGVDISLNVPNTSVETLKKNKSVDLVTVGGPTVNMMRFKANSGITADARVREAMNIAIDRDAILNALLGGLGESIATAQGELSFGNDASIKKYPYDPARAKALLKEAGVAPGTDITLDIYNSDETFREISQVVSSYLGMVGLNLKIRANETNIMASDLIPNGKTGELFQFGWGGWTFDFDNTAYLLYHSGERFNPYINDAKLDELLEQQRATYDRDVREQALQQVAGYIREQSLELPLFNLATMYGVSKKVSGFVPAPDDRVRYMNVVVAE